MATSDAGVEALLVADDSNSYDTAEVDYGDSDGGGATQPTSLGSKFINKKGRILNGVLAGKGGRSSKEQNSAANANHLRRYERDALAEDREPLLMEDNLREQEQEQYREDGDELEEEEEEEDDDDDETDDDDDMPLNAHDDETMSVLTPCSASVAATGVAAATTAAVATTATMKKRTNGGIAKRAATLAAASEATKAEKSSSGTQSKAKTGAVITGGAAAGAYLFHKHREEKNDASSSSSTAAAPSDTANSNSTNPSSGRTKSKSGLLFLGVGAGLAAAAGGVAAASKRKSADADSNCSTTWISKDADGCWSDDVSKSTKSSRHKKTRWSNQSTKPSKSGRKGFLLFGAGAAAVAAIRSRQGRKNAVDNARELTGQEGIVAANKQADGDSADSKGSRFGLGRRSLAGFRYKVTVDEPPAASEAAFVGPPRYDWIDIETAAAVKVQAAWRRYNTIKDLQRQDLYTVGMRNRGRAHRGALLYDHEYNTDGTGCLDAFDIKCGYDCGLDGYGFGTRRGMQNDDVPDFMACCGVGNLL